MKTNDQIRRENLVIAISRAGSAAKLAELMGTSPAYLSQLKNQVQDSKSGTPKSMGDDFARRLEEALGLVKGWMDRDHIHPSPHHDESARALSEEDSIPYAAPLARPAHVQWVSDEEAELLDAYRTTDVEGRQSIRFAAQSVTRVALLGITSHKK
jgi:hypothetical protein